MPSSKTNEENKHIELGERFKDLETRIDNIPLETAVEVANQYNCSPEFAKVVYLLNVDLNIDPELILADLEWELDRRAKRGRPLPKVGSYYYNFAVAEAKWIAFLRGTFPNTLKKNIRKFYRLHKKMNEKRTEDLEDIAMEIVMERQYIAANTIIPVIQRWVETHKVSKNFDIVLKIFAALTNELISEKKIKTIKSEKEKLIKELELIGNILANAKQGNWIVRALIETEIIHEDLMQATKDITYKGASDLVIWLTMVTAFEKDPKKQEPEEDITKMILQFHLESALGLAKASPIATLEYKLLALEKEDLLTKSEKGEEIIREAWKEVRLWKQSLDVGREILGLLIDHGNFPIEFSSKVPTHFEYIINNYQKDPIRLVRVKERLEAKNGEPSETEIYDEIIVDYLIQFYNNYILRKKKVDSSYLTIPKEKPTLDLTTKEREIVNRLDEGLQRGIRTQQRSKTIEILESLLPAMYRQGLNSGLEAFEVAEVLLYGILNLNGNEISREEAKKILLKHLDRMKISLTKTSKKLLDSALCQALSIEFKDKIINNKFS